MLYENNTYGFSFAPFRKGPMGFGFTIRSVRVYLGEQSDYYTIEHLVTKVEEGSPAYESGIRPNDLITHVNSQPVSNLTHPQLLHRLLAYGNELSLKVGYHLSNRRKAKL